MEPKSVDFFRLINFQIYKNIYFNPVFIWWPNKLIQIQLIYMHPYHKIKIFHSCNFLKFTTQHTTKLIFFLFLADWFCFCYLGVKI